MKIGEEAYVHGYIDEIRNGMIIIRNKGGYFGTEPEEVFPSAQPKRKKGKWTTEEVAEILFNAFGDDCACNFNGIDEWLPERCKYTQIAGECPEPKEKHGCWMQFLLQGGGDMRGESDDI